MAKEHARKRLSEEINRGIEMFEAGSNQREVGGYLSVSQSFVGRLRQRI